MKYAELCPGAQLLAVKQNGADTYTIACTSHVPGLVVGCDSTDAPAANSKQVSSLPSPWRRIPIAQSACSAWHYEHRAAAAPPPGVHYRSAADQEVEVLVQL